MDKLDESFNLDHSIEDLNDDCIFEIFQRMPCDSLFAMAKTCTRFSQLAGIQYRRLHPTKTVYYQILDDTVEMRPKVMDIQTFGSKLLHVVIRGEGQNWHMAEHAIHYIATHCSPDLISVRFENMMLSKVHTAALKHLLHRVEKLTFHKTTFVDDFYYDFLRHCDALKHLTISQSIGMVEMNQMRWLNMEYPGLESICISGTQASSFQISYQWQRFFQQNPSIKSFSCHFIYAKDPAERSVKVIERHARQLERLYLSLFGIGHLNSTYYDLSVLCNKPTFKFLELHINAHSVHCLIHHRKMLATFRKLKAIHLTNIPLDPVICDALISFTNLQQINFTNCYVGAECAELLAKGLINLERIYGDWKIYELSYFLRYSKTLLEIHLNTGWTSFLSSAQIFHDILKDSRQARFLLSNALPVTIYVNFEDSEPSPSENILTPSMMRPLDCFEIKHESNSELFNVKNTFSTNCI